MYGLLAPVRRALLRDPLAAFRKVMDAAPPTDRAVMDDPDWQRVLIEDQREELRQGAEGWADEAMAMFGSWDFDPSPVSCSLTWWHGEHDADAPIAAVRRLVATMGDVDLQLWNEAGIWRRTVGTTRSSPSSSLAEPVQWAPSHQFLDTLHRTGVASVSRHPCHRGNRSAPSLVGVSYAS